MTIERRPSTASSGRGVFRLFLPGHPPTANELKRMHWHKQNASRAEWKKLTYYSIKEVMNRPMKGELNPVVLHFTFVYSQRRKRDIDNLIASVKPIVDGLVLGDIIPDDDASVVKGYLVDVVVSKDQPLGTHVEVISQEITRQPLDSSI